MRRLKRQTSRRHFLQTAVSTAAAGMASTASARPRSLGGLKITGIKTYKFSTYSGKPWLYLKIETNSEISGWGEGSGEWLVEPVEATLRNWIPLLVDRNPLQVVELTEDIQNRIPWKGGPVFGTAIAAINSALYDIAGKAWGVPVHMILGGKRRDRVRVYTGASLFESPEKAAEAARRTVDNGYTAMKSVPLEARTRPMDERVLEHCVKCLAAARQAVSSETDILLDTHGSPTPELSLEFSRRIAPYRPLFLEEPVKVGSVAALLAVSRRSPVPIATGEKLFTLRDFRPLIDQRACAFLQPDLSHSFGISHILDIAAAAEEAQMLMALHMTGGPLAYAASLTADSVMNNFLIQETHGFDYFHRYADHDWTIQDGYVNVSDRPGLGIEVKEPDIAKLPYQPYPFRQYRHADGSWKGW